MSAAAFDGEPQRQKSGCGGAGDQARPIVRIRSSDRRAALADRGEIGPEIGPCRRTDVANAAVSNEASTVDAPEVRGSGRIQDFTGSVYEHPRTNSSFSEFWTV